MSRESQTIRWWTPANLLTGLRLVAAPACAAAILLREPGVALALFAFAVLSDFADGPLARSRGEATPLGGVLDHATDATFVTLGLGSLVGLGMIPAALPILVALAFAQYLLDSDVVAGRPLRASFLGRWNGIAYFVALGIPVVRDGIGLGWPGDAWVRAVGWLLVGTTGLSMLDRGVAFFGGRRE